MCGSCGGVDICCCCDYVTEWEEKKLKVRPFPTPQKKTHRSKKGNKKQSYKNITTQRYIAKLETERLRQKEKLALARLEEEAEK